MSKKHLIIGTAGHVDHGKTTLIKALTGYDCDTHKEEKQRGITINLGFTHLDLPSGNSLGIVDVPGHADFIKTTVSGASGLDLVMLVIAADEGIMPQTKEHLAIMDLMGIEHGIIVVTKIDSVDEDILMLAQEEIREFVEGTFLAKAPIMEVSSLDNSGIGELLNQLDKIIDIIPEKNKEGFFRLYIDRIFSQPGFGTIVNGSVLSGVLHKDDPIYMLPGGKELKVRRLERHGQQVDYIQAGDRASINLANLKIKDFYRGMMLSGKMLEDTDLIDVRIKLFDNSQGLNLWSQVIFLLGTIRLMARVHLLEDNYLEPGKEGLAQIYLPRKSILQLGDRFIIRNSSGDKTLGGGLVVDPYPLHHRRRRTNQIEIVKEMSSGEISDLITAEVRKHLLPLSYREIASHLAMPADNLIDPIFQGLRGDIVFFQSENDIILMEKKKKTALQNKIINGLMHYHKMNPLFDTGRSFNELMGVFGDNRTDITRITLKLILEELVEDNKIKKVGNTWVHASHSVKLDEQIKHKIALIEDYIKNTSKEFVEPDDIWFDLRNNFKDEKEVDKLLKYLLKNETIINVKQQYVHIENFSKRKKQLIDYLKEHQDEGMTTSTYRTLINSNRNTAVMYLEFFDSEGITLRKGNERFLTAKFLKKIT